MTATIPHNSDTNSPSSQAPSLSPASSLPSHSSRASSSRTNDANLPQPPANDRIPPPKNRSTHPHKFKLGRKDADENKDKVRKHSRKHSSRGVGGDLEDDWMMTDVVGPTPNALASSSSRGSDTLSPPAAPSPPLFDSQLTEVPHREEKKEKKGRGRGLAKKTSQLFSRSKDKGDSGSGAFSPENGSVLRLPPSSSRQTSYSSAASGDSTSTSNSTSNRHPFSLHRPGSNSSRNRSPRSSHSRRLSQDSSSSWQNPPRTMRSGSTSTYDSPTENHLPIPQRQGSQLSASVPTLTRQSLPAPSSLPDNNGTIPSRMSTWFSHLLPSTSTTPVPPPPPEQASASPQRKPASAAASFLNAARQRAVDGVRHLLDTEAQPDKCPDPMWVMGVPHPGWRPSTPVETPSSFPRDLADERPGRRGSGSSDRPSPPSKADSGTLRPAIWKKGSQPISPPAKGFGNIFSTSTLSLALPASATNGSPVKEGDRTVVMESPSKGKKTKADKEVLTWPTQFHDDFRSRIWCTYRSQYAPILALPPSLLIPSPYAYYSAFGPPADLAGVQAASNSNPAAAPAKMSSSPWSWSRAEGGLTSDAGWGCMLRTGQSMLANALIHLHLGRDWRLPLTKPSTSPTATAELEELEAYATYVRVLSWFLDDPSPLCPFSVHRMALIGKELGKEVGEWFGPSTAAGALKTLGNSFPLCGLAVATATDSMVYKSDVYAASHMPSDGWTNGKDSKRTLDYGAKNGTFGPKAVLVLIGIRLGLDGVNPIYYESVKTLFTFPQSVGIAGGRPSSSYYFVASQANSLFYLDPHFTRPAVPLEVPPAPGHTDAAPNGRKGGADGIVMNADESGGPAHALDVVNVDDITDEETASDSSSPTARRRKNKATTAGKRLSAPPVNGSLRQAPSTPPRPIAQPESAADSFGMSDTDHEPTPRSTSTSASQDAALPVDTRTVWYANAYPEPALKTFHCEKVKKMPLSGLDPSMLLGFLISSQEDFDDFCERVKALPQKIFTVQDEPPSWDEDDDTGLESVSEPDLDGMNDLEVEREDEDDELADSFRSKLDSGGLGDVSATTIQPVDIARKKSRDGVVVVGEDEEGWTEELASTPGQGRSVEAWEGVHTRHAPRPPPAPLGMSNGETESWIRPSLEVQAAPNGGNVL